LSIVGNELRITIPEQWLSEAKYPVVVDPTVGTTTIGSQTQTAFMYASGMTENGLRSAIVVNQYSMPEAYNGTINAFVYANNRSSFGQCKPVLYADFGGMQPMARRSADEGLFDIVVNLTDKPAGWRSTTFNTSSNIQTGFIWYGISAVNFFFVFDFANKAFWYPYSNGQVNIPNSYPLFPDQRNYNYRISMYFNFTNPQNYIRTLTQGITLSDLHKNTADYKRTAIQTVRGSANIFRFEAFFRQCFENVKNNMSLVRLPAFSRSVNEQVKISDDKKTSRDMSRKFEDTLFVNDKSSHSQGFFSFIGDCLIGTDKVSFSVLFVRSVFEIQKATDTMGQCRDYIRGLYDEVGSLAEAVRWGEFYRRESDTVRAEGVAFRHLFIFIKILTVSVVRDFILRRFLIARKELVLKSPICRELTLESQIG
jgi:hypothetical protein